MLQEPRLTKPWQPDEFIHVNGQPLVYTHDPHGEILVHYPGCERLRIGLIKACGRRVDMPVKARKTSYVARPRDFVGGVMASAR